MSSQEQANIESSCVEPVLANSVMTKLLAEHHKSAILLQEKKTIETNSTKI